MAVLNSTAEGVGVKWLRCSDVTRTWQVAQTVQDVIGVWNMEVRANELSHAQSGEAAGRQP